MGKCEKLQNGDKAGGGFCSRNGKKRPGEDRLRDAFILALLGLPVPGIGLPQTAGILVGDVLQIHPEGAAVGALEFRRPQAVGFQQELIAEAVLPADGPAALRLQPGGEGERRVSWGSKEPVLWPSATFASSAPEKVSRRGKVTRQRPSTRAAEVQRSPRRVLSARASRETSKTNSW